MRRQHRKSATAVLGFCLVASTGANKVVNVAMSGDDAQMKPRFRKGSDTCLACHDKRKAKRMGNRVAKLRKQMMPFDA